MGTIIGFVNTLILFPAFLSTEQIGLLRAIPSTAFMIMPLVQLGAPRTLLKFAPEASKKNSGLAELYTGLIMVICVGYGLILIVYHFFGEQVTAIFSKNAPAFNEFISVTLVLILIFAVYTLTENYSRILLKTIAINIIKEILVRLLIGISVTLYFLKIISFEMMIYSLLGIYSIAISSLCIYLRSIGHLQIKWPGRLFNRDIRRRMTTYSFYGLIGSGGGYIVLNIDQVMISSMLGLDQNGIYVTASYFAFMIELSRRMLSQITTPMVSNHFENGELDKIKIIYQKTSVNQMIIGIFIFIGLTINMENVYALMPNGEAFRAGFPIVYLIGFSKLLIMIFGNNGEIISMSNHYKFTLVVQFILAGLMIGFNLILIPRFGITGAAMATLSAMFSFNLIKMTYIKYQFGFMPFTINSLGVLGIGSLTWAVGYFLFRFENPIIDLMIRSLTVAVLYGLLIYYTKMSPEVNSILNRLKSLISK